MERYAEAFHKVLANAGVAARMKAGAAQIDITPNRAARCPASDYGGRQPVSTIRSMLRRWPSRRVAKFLLLVACDLLLVDDLLLGDIRRRVSEATGLAPERVWISATHTHTGPSILGVLGTTRIRSIESAFPSWAARAAITAWEKREEAVLGMAAGPAPGWTFPRRYWMRDGTVRMHPLKGSPEIVRAEGVADNGLGVLWARAAAEPRPADSSVLSSTSAAIPSS